MFIKGAVLLNKDHKKSIYDHSNEVDAKSLTNFNFQGPAILLSNRANV